MTRRVAACWLHVLIAGAIAWTVGACAEASQEHERVGEVAGARTSGRLANAAGTPQTGMYPVYQSPNFLQGLRWGSPEFGAPASAVYVQHKHRDLATGDWAKYTYEYTTSFEVRYVAPQERDRFFVLGELDGVFVIERWLLVYRANGNPVTPPSVRRSVLYNGAVPSDLIKMAADPEGRFLLFLHGAPRRLSRFDTVTKQFVDVSEQLGMPPLDHYDSLARRHHETQGRVWILYNDIDLVRLLLSDADNDGHFEGALEFTDIQWESAGYNGAVWTSDFLRGV